MKFYTVFTPAFLLVTAQIPAAELTYNRDVRPILSENCFHCHGPDEKARKAGLRLDVAESAYAPIKGVTPIVPGDPAKSEVWKRLQSTDPDEVMPPPEAHATMKPAQIATLKKWIEEGAKYQQHWAFLPPLKTAPLGQNEAGSAIDAFIQARLAQENLQPSKEAERPVLLRRLALDLTGLPPSAEEVEAFANDPAPNAYEKQVDRLLASSHFGERLALDWLDAARYADTNGYSIDGGRHQWLWRDYVINAFNTDKPYDEFIAEQIAGDLMPDATDEQVIATGFQRNNMVTHEGGTIPAENLTNYNVDRVKTLGESVLGLTLACAQCHDHKFDPITQNDYYRLYAYFNTLGDAGLDGDGGKNPGPFKQLRTVLRPAGEEETQTAERDRLRAELANPSAEAMAAWEKEQHAALALRGKDFQLKPAELLKISTPNSGAGFEIEQGKFAVIKQGGFAAYDIAFKLPAGEKPVTGIRVVFHPDGDKPDGAWGHGLPAGAKRGTFRVSGINVSADTMTSDQVNLFRELELKSVTANTWSAEDRPEGVLETKAETGWSPDQAHQGAAHLTLTFAKPLLAAETPFLTLQLNFRNMIAKRMEILAMSGQDDGSPLPAAIIAVLQTAPNQRTAPQQAELKAYFSAQAPALERARVALANTEERLATLTQSFPTMVMNESEKPRETFILNRGDYAQPTIKVTPGTPGFLPALDATEPPSRLALARWLTNGKNPLTARVAVNRFWQMLFGTGIVRTAADFGAQGEWPSHPELLDWLAVDFMETGWKVKPLLRQIVLSKTYRQSSAATPEALERDPANTLLARGPRFRLPAEIIRDSALKVSGLYAPRIGGPSVNPYSPGDLWREVSHYGSSPATAQSFNQDHGEKLYRRSLYTYWKRTAPPPNMTAFDAPNREVCTVTRSSTNTPLQALVLLNDTQYVEAARAFAARILAQTGDDAAKLRWAFEETTSRLPNARELTVLTAALRRERERYSQDASAVEALLSVGESPVKTDLPSATHAAWTQVAALMLNLSETVTRN